MKKNRTIKRAACILFAFAIIFTLFPVNTAYALTKNKTMVEDTTETFETASYTSFTYKWSISSGSEYISITSGTTSKTCTVKAIKPGKAVLKVVRTRSGRLTRSYTDTFNITVNEDPEKDKPMSTEVLDAVGIDPSELEPNTALIYIDGVPTIFFLTKTSRANTKNPYDTYTLNSVKNGTLDQEIQLQIRHKQRQGMTVSTKYKNPTASYSMAISYYNPYNEPVMFAYRSGSVYTSYGSLSSYGNNEMTLTARSDELNHVEGVFTGNAKSKWSGKVPEFLGAFKLTYGETAEQTRELYEAEGGHLPDDEELKAMDREVFESYIASLEKARTERQQQRAYGTCTDCGGTGWCSRCGGYGKVVVRDVIFVGTTVTDCAHCNNQKVCPTCHGAKMTR